MPVALRIQATPFGLIRLLPLALTACAATKESDPALAHACQLKPCICAPAQTVLFRRDDNVPLQWKQNGDAYCPEGYVLRLDTKKK
ncbi:MAG: hypothetical protein ACFCUQ_03120 [Kiloniellales bacterium]